jgi:hypothetical protein
LPSNSSLINVWLLDCKRRVKNGTHVALTLERTPGRLLNWALSIGPATRDVAQYQLESKSHPEIRYRACLGRSQRKLDKIN